MEALDQASKMEWYQQGIWPLVGAMTLIVLSLYKILLTANETLKSQLKIREIDLIDRKLRDFYDPMLAALTQNGNLFMALGPHTFPPEPHKRISATEVWDEIKEKIILPNNEKMLSILSQKSHLVSNLDSIENYDKLQTHLVMYKIFNEKPSEIYKDFQFPKEIINHVKEERDFLVNLSSSLYG